MYQIMMTWEWLWVFPFVWRSLRMMFCTKYNCCYENLKEKLNRWPLETSF
jgi:hypothetical protein